MQDASFTCTIVCFCSQHRFWTSHFLSDALEIFLIVANCIVSWTTSTVLGFLFLSRLKNFKWAEAFFSIELSRGDTSSNTLYLRLYIPIFVQPIWKSKSYDRPHVVMDDLTHKSIPSMQELRMYCNEVKWQQYGFSLWTLRQLSLWMHLWQRCSTVEIAGTLVAEETWTNCEFKFNATCTDLGKWKMFHYCLGRPLANVNVTSALAVNIWQTLELSKA